jgi:hypothetical protein
MSDPQQESTGEDAPGFEEESKEIARSIGGVWQDFAGQRPRSIDVEVLQDRVRCVIDERADAARDEGDGEASDDTGLSPHSVGYGYRASAAVARITHRRVVGYIPSRDQESQTSTQVFILRRELRRY